MGIWEGYSFEGLRIKEEDVEFHNILEDPIKIYGLCNPKEHLNRLDRDFAKTVSGGVFAHSENSSGGRIRFATDSPYIAIKIKHRACKYASPHNTRLNATGVDLYVKKEDFEGYFGSYLPPLDTDSNYEGIKKLGDGKFKEITLYMPIGTAVLDMEIGIKSGSVLKPPAPYKTEKPIVFYGSSITNGYAASRPGNTYEGFISRKLDCNFLNLGFSGSALGESALAEYISQLDMTAFVLDYDHNAPDCQHLMKTHEQFFNIIREKNPDLPIVMISRPESVITEDGQSRRDVIMNTYLNARNKGDKNVYFIDGYTFFPDDCKNDCTVDGCHPNDLGMYFIAQRISKILNDILRG